MQSLTLSSYHSHIPTDYEERTGQYPATRSMEAIPNVHAVVRVDVVYQVDHQGGRSIAVVPPASNFTKLEKFQV